MARRTLVVGTLTLAGAVAAYGLLSRLGYVMPVSALPSVLCFDGCPTSKSLHQPTQGEALLKDDRDITDVLGFSNLEKQKVSVLIEKAKYRLTVHYDRQPVKSYPIVLGSAPTGDKLRGGRSQNPRRHLSDPRSVSPPKAGLKFLWLDYPTEESWQKHLEAKRSGKLDLAATIGGEVGIHGVPEGNDAWIDAKQNWTWGCASLKNKDIDELYSVVQTGTIVEIVP